MSGHRNHPRLAAEPASHRFGARPVLGAATRGEAGISAMEMLIVLSIAAVLMTVAAPAMSTFLANNRLQAATLDLYTALVHARGEAAKQRLPVLLCKTSDPEAAAPSCDTATGSWSGGWLEFASLDGNTTYDAANDHLLRAGAIPSGVTVAANSAAANTLGFNPDGTTMATTTARFALCDSRGGAVGRQINIPPVGRPAMVQGTASATIDCTNPS